MCEEGKHPYVYSKNYEREAPIFLLSPQPRLPSLPVPSCIDKNLAKQHVKVQSMRKEVQKLGLEKIFDVDEFDRNPVWLTIKGWGISDADLDDRRLTKKLIALMLFNSSRLAPDMARLGFSKIRLDEAKGKLFYRLQKEGAGDNSEGDWSAEQFLSRLALQEGDEGALCPYRTAQTYLQRTAPRRAVSTPDRLFLSLRRSPDGQDKDDVGPMKGDEISELLWELLNEAGVDPLLARKKGAPTPYTHRATTTTHSPSLFFS